MCFSATASFSASAGLTLIGIIAATQMRSPKQILLGISPFLLAFQQFVEGMQWINLQSHGAKWISNLLGLGYLLEASIWPIYIPLSLLPFEKSAKRRKWIWFFVFSGVIYSLVNIYNIFKREIVIQIINSHISYGNVSVISLIIYCSILIFPTFIINVDRSVYFKILGVLFASSFVFAYLVSEICAASVWCFFAAFCSIFVLVILRKVPIS